MTISPAPQATATIAQLQNNASSMVAPLLGNSRDIGRQAWLKFRCDLKRLKKVERSHAQISSVHPCLVADVGSARDCRWKNSEGE